MSRVEQPEYKVEKQDGSIEIRAYGPLIAAEAVVQGERKAAINEGFQLIAGYIFGKNEPQAKIAMTAPVEQQKSQKIAMTAPVTQQGEENSWTVRFIMPKSCTMQTLPVPSDPRVKLEPLPERRFLVVTFSGLARNDAIKSRTAVLRQYAASQKLATAGEPLPSTIRPGRCRCSAATRSCSNLRSCGVDFTRGRPATQPPMCRARRPRP